MGCKAWPRLPPCLPGLVAQETLSRPVSGRAVFCVAGPGSVQEGPEPALGKVFVQSCRAPVDGESVVHDSGCPAPLLLGSSESTAAGAA